jgi:hypothetical protein
LDDDRRIAALRFTQQQVNVLRHDDIADNHEMVATANLLQDAEKEVTIALSGQQRLPLVATGGDEMNIVGSVVATRARGHYA